MIEETAIEETDFAPLVDAPDKPESSKKPIFFLIGLIFSLLGILTPLAVFIAARLTIPRPCCGEDGTPGDGLALMLLMIYGIVWWTLAEFFSLAFTISGFARKESGRMKITAVAAAILSIVLLGLVYLAAIVLVMYSTRASL